MLEFAISSARVGSDGWIVSVSGEADLYNAPALEQQLVLAVEDERYDVVVDLGGAFFVDSTVLGVVLAAARHLEELGGSLVLVTDDRRLMRVVEGVGLDRHVRVEPSLTDAVDRVAAGGRA